MRVKSCVPLGLLLVMTVWTRPLSAADAPGVSIVAGRARSIPDRRELATRYYMGPDAAKPYFWPLNGPGGVRLTRAWPMEAAGPGESADHVHQKSAWFGHGDVIPEGMELKHKANGISGVDFWTEEAGHGQIVCTEVGKPAVTVDHGQILTHNEWRTAEGSKVLDETRIIHLHNLGMQARFARS